MVSCKTDQTMSRFYSDVLHHSPGYIMALQWILTVPDIVVVSDICSNRNHVRLWGIFVLKD